MCTFLFFFLDLYCGVTDICEKMLYRCLRIFLKEFRFSSAVVVLIIYLYQFYKGISILFSLRKMPILKVVAIISKKEI